MKAILWKPLTYFGILFWLSLCVLEFFKTPQPKEKLFNNDTIQEKSYIQNIFEITAGIQNRINIGTSLLIWNLVTFISTILICVTFKINPNRNWFLLRNYFEVGENLEIRGSGTNSVAKKLFSKSTITLKNSSNSSYASLESMKDCKSNKNECQTLFKNKRFEEKQAKFNNERLVSQQNSLQEKSELTRKLKAISREKIELTKQLNDAFKENKAVKKQFENVVQQKEVILKRLNDVTNICKVDSRSKNLANLKLDDVTKNISSLKLQLNQINKEKEMLQTTLNVLETEYRKVQQRLRFRCPEIFDFVVPERDSTTKNVTGTNLDPEMDMKKINTKISQLEKNFKNFNTIRKQSRNCSMESITKSNSGVDHKNVENGSGSNSLLQKLNYSCVASISGLGDILESDLTTDSDEDGAISSSVLFQKFLSNLKNSNN